METSGFSTYRGIPVEKIVTPLDASTALRRITDQIDTHKGALMVSNYEVPDRYSRWDIGFINPPLELVARERSFSLNALTRMVSVCCPCYRKCWKAILTWSPLRSHLKLSTESQAP